MHEIAIRQIEKPIHIFFSGQQIELPASVQETIDTYWQESVEQNPKLRNGEVFTVTNVYDTKQELRIELYETNYAHYMYDYRVGELGKDGVRIIHSSALPITTDNQLIFGSMSGTTSRHGVIQCAGGGIDHDDIDTNGVVDLDANTAREVAEELGIDVHDPDTVELFVPTHLKYGGPSGKFTVAYTVRLKLSSEEFLRSYDSFVEQLKCEGKEPEFEEIFTLTNEPHTIEYFINKYGNRLDEYMPILLREISQKHL